MNYEIFKAVLLEKLEEITEHSTFKVKYEDMLKNNGQKIGAVIIQQKNRCIAPIIYLDEWYGEFLKGESIDEIAEEILLLSRKALAKDRIPSIPEINWESVKDKLYVSVINADANEEMLSKTPHRRIDDLAIIAKIRVGQPENGNASIRVTNTVLPMLARTKDEVINQAIANTEKLNFECRAMHEVLRDILGNNEEMMNEFFFTRNSTTMHVVSLPDTVEGASILACRETLARMIDKVGEDVYILPSSINEILLVPKSVGMQLEDLQGMVWEINRKEVSAGEILSDNVYQFDRKSKRLSIAKANDDTERKTMFRTFHISM